MRIKIDAASVVFEFEGKNPVHARMEADLWIAAFQDFPGFDLCEVEKKPDPREDADDDTILKWVQGMPGNHSVSYLQKHSPYRDTRKALKRLLDGQKLETAETLYQGRKHMQTMMAVYMPGDVPLHVHDPVGDMLKVAAWVKVNPGRKVKYVEDHCGVIRSRAHDALTRLIAKGDIMVKSVDGASVVFLGEGDDERQTDSKEE